jgi:signal transduction histidine kinase/ligand-binding sensor domain-containing protein
MAEKHKLLIRLSRLSLMFVSVVLCGQSPQPQLDYTPTDIHHEVLTTWTTGQGLPQDFVTAIAQTRDGFLWVGTLGGLARFDGLHFRTFAGDAPPALQDRISDLARDGENGLWIGTASGLFHLVRGEFRAIPCKSNTACRVESLAASADGGVWVFTGQQLLHTQGEQLREFSLPFDARELRAMCEGANHTLWFSNGENIFALQSGASHEGKSSESWPQPNVGLLYAAPSGEIYAGDGHRLYRFQNGHFALVESPGLGNFVDAMVDSQHRLWMASGGLHGISRQSNGVAEHLTADDGLASDDVRLLLEDHNQDVWLGTIAGLQRLHRGLFTTYTEKDGLPGVRSQYEAVFEDRSGTLWAGTLESGIARLQNGKWHRFGPQDGIRAGQVRGFADGDSGLIVALSDYGLFSWKDGRFVKIPGIPRGYLVAPTRATDGSLWFGILRQGLFRLQGKHLTHFGTADGLPATTIWSIQSSSNGHLWIGTSHSLYEWTGNAFRIVASTDNPVYAITPIGSGDLALGTLGGIVLLHDGKRWTLTKSQGMPANMILSIVQDDLRNLWVVTASAIVRIPRSQIDAVLDGRASSVSPQAFTEADGLHGAAVLPVNQINALRARDGRLWFATVRGISSVDPHLTPEPIPTAVLDSIFVDEHQNLPRNLSIAPGRHRITFQFTSSTLPAADQIRFRYRMDNWDSSWLNADKSREASYSGLPPGNYRFEVVAINREGTTNPVPASVEIRLKPHFWQTRTFLLLAVLIGIALIIEVTRRRTRAKAERLSLRFQERAAERERIAYQIHDTVIQDMIGTALKLELLGHQIDEEPLTAQGSLNGLAASMRDTIARSRNMVSSLHSTAVPQYSLLDLLKNAEAEFRLAEEPEFRLVSEGQPRPLHPFIRDEVYRICREAVANAFRHANAGCIEVHVRFGTETLDVEIRDDGHGMDNETREHGRPGHFGLRGMQAHADRIGAAITIDSSLQAGTRVRLHVKTKRWNQGRLRRWLHSHSGEAHP